ncbi:MAG: methyltransferase domain-containing protein [Conexivisphaerales archaeon]
MNLDVGCGNRKLGDINVDIDKKYRPDVVCDIHYLPFKENVFERVYCYHVLEHYGIKPEKAISELLRVSKKWVEIQVPHWLSKPFLYSLPFTA